MARTPSRLRVVLTAFISAVALASCGGGRDVTPLSSASLKTTIVNMGTRYTTRYENFVTAYSFTSLPQSPPQSDRQYGAADVEGCAGETPPPGTAAAPQLFFLETTDGLAWRTTEPVKTPALHLTRLARNRCARGWITFSFPKDRKPDFVVFISGEIVKWRIQ